MFCLDSQTISQYRIRGLLPFRDMLRVCPNLKQNWWASHGLLCAHKSGVNQHLAHSSPELGITSSTEHWLGAGWWWQETDYMAFPQRPFTEVRQLHSFIRPSGIPYILGPTECQILLWTWGGYLLSGACLFRPETKEEKQTSCFQITLGRK